jgi:hypothetical protein
VRSKPSGFQIEIISYILFFLHSRFFCGHSLLAAGTHCLPQNIELMQLSIAGCAGVKIEKSAKLAVGMPTLHCAHEILFNSNVNLQALLFI